MNAKVYIRGAYGPGNLGDDMLMLCVINILKNRYLASDITVGVENPGLARKFNSHVNWLHIKQPINADLVVLGGGGQFFSFIPPVPAPPSLSLALSKTYHRIKAQADLKSLLLRLYVGARGGVDKIFFHRRLAAFCIGLGPFDGGGAPLSRAFNIINRCDYVSVRDKTSQQHCSTFGKPDVHVYTDPTLLSALWISKKELCLSRPATNKYLSFILRDWPHDSNGQAYITAMLRAAEACAKRGESVRLVSLFKARDQHLIDSYSNYEWLCWDPAVDSVEHFMATLVGESEVIISTRAHGVLLPAALGVPTIAVAIENKLKKVHEMLPRGTRLVSAPDSQIILKTIGEFRLAKEQMVECLQQEISVQSSVVQHSVDDFLNWLDQQ